MRRIYPILAGAWGLIFAIAVVGPAGSYVYDKYWNANTLTRIEQTVEANRLAVILGLALLAVLTLWAYLDDKRQNARDSVEAEPAPADRNVVVQNTVIVKNQPGSNRLVPMQIALPPPDFTGREQELNELVDAVRKGGATISALRGMGGIGKTALAQKVAHILKPDFPDGQIYLDLKGAKHEDDALQNLQPLTASDALRHIVTSLGHEVRPDATVDQLAGLYRTILTDKRVLLLMDNARDEKQVKPLIPPTGSVMIVTSRQSFTLPGLFAKNLDTLSSTRASELLLKIAPRIGGDAGKIAELCGYLPLALRAVASAIAERPTLTPQDFLRSMSDAKGRLKLTGVDLALTTSSELLEEELRSCWLLLGVFPDTFEFNAAAAIWERESDAAKDALGDLFRYSLVEWNPVTSRYRLHDLTRDFTSLQLDESTRMKAQGRHAAHYKDVLAAANEKYKSGGAGVLESLAVFDLEWSNIQVGQAWAATHSDREQSAAQLCMVYPYTALYVLFLRQPARERIKWLEAALNAARKLRSRTYEAAAFGNIGIAYENLGENRRAIEFYERQLLIVREIGERRSEGGLLGNLGIAHASLGEYHRAVGFHEQALEISREFGDRLSESQDLGNLGNAYYSLGENRRAIEFHEQALVISRDIGDRLSESQDLGNLGNAYRALGDYHTAIEFHKKSLLVAHEIGDRQGEGVGLINSALDLDAQGERSEAIRRAEQALIILEQIESPDAEKVRELLAAWRKPS